MSGVQDQTGAVQDSTSLSGKLAVVSGASRGIGAACAALLAQRGATVIGTATREQGAESITRALAPWGGSGRVLDVSDSDATGAFFKTLEREPPLTILVNNAGITHDNLLLRMKPEAWDRVIETNLGGAFRMSRLALKRLLKATDGRIINISSVVARSGNPGQANYVASKAGLEGFTRALALEVASRAVTVNAVAPGFIETDMTAALNHEQREAITSGVPLARLGRPADVAAAVAFLASAEAGYITGQTLQVNGGLYMA